jgi:hypothetical protein
MQPVSESRLVLHHVAYGMHIWESGMVLTTASTQGDTYDRLQICWTARTSTCSFILSECENSASRRYLSLSKIIAPSTGSFIALYDILINKLVPCSNAVLAMPFFHALGSLQKQRMQMDVLTISEIKRNSVVLLGGMLCTSCQHICHLLGETLQSWLHVGKCKPISKHGIAKHRHQDLVT